VSGESLSTLIIATGFRALLAKHLETLVSKSAALNINHWCPSDSGRNRLVLCCESCRRRLQNWDRQIRQTVSGEFYRQCRWNPNYVKQTFLNQRDISISSPYNICQYNSIMELY
jgi:hypothetical protein